MPYTTREVYDFISQQTHDPIVERKTCTVSGQPFPIYQSDLEFYEKISPIFNGQKFQIPTPTLCPEERQRRRYARRNERKLYRRNCDFSVKEIISSYSPDKPYKVYDQKMYRADERDPLDYGQFFDTTWTFTQQFADFFSKIPHPSLYSINPENSEYTNFAINDKNCYLVCCGGENENCYYVSVMANSDNCADGFSVYDCSYCYNAVCSEKCYNCCSIVNSNACSRSMFLEDCQWCDNCVMCFGLVNKKNHFLNQPVSEEKIAELKTMTDEFTQGKHPYQQKFSMLKQSSIHKASHNVASEYAEGEMVVWCKNCYNCYAVQNCENCRNINFIYNSQDSRDCDYALPFGTNHSYNLCSGGGTNTSISSFLTVRSSDMYYCAYCLNCRDCFACVGLHDKQYCIFNKQYTPEEYDKEVTRIIWKMQESWEWGKFFHPSLSPFWYNETVANEYLPLTKDNSYYQHGYKRSDYSTDPKIPENAELLYPTKMSEEEWRKLVNDDTITQKIIICKDSGRPFLIQKLELVFYRKMGLPLPKQHPDVRHEARMQQRPWRTLYFRTCDKCKKEIVSIYPSDDTRTVYCEECYQKEVYG